VQIITRAVSLQAVALAPGRVHNVRAVDPPEVGNMTSALDDLDIRILTTLREQPRVGVLEMSRQLGVARGTVSARLEKLQARGVVTGFGPDVDPARIGYPVLAFVFLEIVQGRLDEAVRDLRDVPEVLEAHGVTGTRDLLCRVVARDNGHLQVVINRMVRHPAVRRSTSYISMSRQIDYRVSQLVSQAGRDRRGASSPVDDERVEGTEQAIDAA
jgi:DNA-binding Lrp family transcriptional regulator